MEELERRAALERERARMKEELADQAEEEAKTRYAALMAELEATWRQEAASREVAIEARLTQHFDELLRAKSEQLDLALAINDEMEAKDRQRWAEALEELKRKHLNTMSYGWRCCLRFLRWW